MPVDPDEIKLEEIKRKQKMDEIQKYMEEQDALDKQSKTGKMGHREVKRETLSEKISHILEEAKKFLGGM